MSKAQPFEKAKLENLTIRNATPEDYTPIADLLIKVNLPAQGVQEHVDNFVVLIDDGSLIGTGGLEIYSDKALLRSLAVHPDYQNKGYGQQLYRRILENAHKQNITEVYLLTETAERFFAAMGFEKISRELVDERVKTSEEFRSVCPSTAICMRLTL
jgi:amino-acid N-acetyltransferase